MEKKWEKIDKIRAWQVTKVGNRKEVIEEARKEGNTVHFASLMCNCHLKNSELEHNFKNIKVESYSEVTLQRMIQVHT